MARDLPLPGLAALLLGLPIAAPAAAQQQTAYSYSWSQGRTMVNSSRQQNSAVSQAGVELVLPSSEFQQQNVRPITQPDGPPAYAIIDINQPFGSYRESSTREQEQGSTNRLTITFSGFGYSVFHP